MKEIRRQLCVSDWFVKGYIAESQEFQFTLLFSKSQLTRENWKTSGYPGSASIFPTTKGGWLCKSFVSDELNRRRPRTSFSASTLRCRERSRVTSRDCLLKPPGWGYDQGQHDRNRHHSRDHVESSTIHTIRLAHIGNQQRSECAREAPCSQHQSINGPHIFRAKLVSRECRHRTESAAVTHEDNEGYERQHSSGADAGKSPE